MEPQMPQMNADTLRPDKLSSALISAIRGVTSGFIGGTAADDSFPAKLGKFKIEKQRQLQLADRKITQHLGNVVIGECFHDLRINDHFFINEDVRDQRADQMTTIMDPESIRDCSTR